MTRAKKAPRQASGGARLKAAGRHPVTLGLTPAQRDLIRAAAEKDGRPMTQILLRGGLALAEKILENPGESY